MDQALNSQKTPHTSPLRASYGMSFVSILMKNDRVIKGFYCSRSLLVVHIFIDRGVISNLCGPVTPHGIVNIGYADGLLCDCIKP